MCRDSYSLPFQFVNAPLRKPIIRISLPNGRQIELVGFHLEPGWTNPETPLRIEVVSRRLYPDVKPVFVGEHAGYIGSGWLCLAYLLSDTPIRHDSLDNCSWLLVAGIIQNVDVGVRSMVNELLSKVTWESVASDDSFW